MFFIDCPHCGNENEIEGEDLPAYASQDKQIECQYCEKSFKFGWRAELELRD